MNATSRGDQPLGAALAALSGALGRVRALIAEFAEVLEEPERVADFDALVSSLQDE